MIDTSKREAYCTLVDLLKEWVYEFCPYNSDKISFKDIMDIADKLMEKK